MLTLRRRSTAPFQVGRSLEENERVLDDLR